MHIKSLDQVRFPDHKIVTAYRCIFAASRVLAYVRQFAPLYPEIAFLDFVRSLNDCFCEDIFTTDWDYDEYDDTLSITICTRFVPRDREVQ